MKYVAASGLTAGFQACPTTLKVAGPPEGAGDEACPFGSVKKEEVGAASQMHGGLTCTTATGSLDCNSLSSAMCLFAQCQVGVPGAFCISPKGLQQDPLDPKVAANDLCGLALDMSCK